MKPGSGHKLIKLLLKDNKALKPYSLPASWLKTSRQRQAFMRQWQESCPLDSIFLWQSDQGQESLLLLQAGPLVTSGTRVLLYPGQEVNFSTEDCLALCQDLFNYFPELYDLSVTFQGSKPPEAEMLKELEEAGLQCWCKAWCPGPWPQAKWGFYFRRLALSSSLIHVPFHNFGILLQEDREHAYIISVEFVQTQEVFSPGPPAFLLNDLGLLDADGRYQPGTILQGQAEASSDSPMGKISYSPLLREAEKQVTAYLAGETRDLDLPYKIVKGTPFQRQVWEAMKKIPYGTAWSYGDLATKVVGPEKAPAYARAIGRACAANPLGLLIPCHRVIGQDGQLVGFGGSVEMKGRLLNLEMFNYQD